MTVQVLVATMNQIDYSLLEKMNIRTSAIVCNQCDKYEYKRVIHHSNEIHWFSFNEKGVGLNRNNALMRASGEFCLFADDDMVYVDNYDQIVIKAFGQNPTADVIVFNLKEQQPTRKIIKRTKKVGYFNYLRYGTARIAIKLNSIKKHGIYFNQCFGGGTAYCHGEDNLFLNSCLKKGLRIVAVQDYIASLTDERPSSWNTGYNEKYIMDQGALYRALSRKWWRLLCIQDVLRRHGSYRVSIIKAYRLMVQGAQNYL